ncbi:MAG: hypothetical protein ACEPOW_12545 [Bacteroidales bacterium]
MKTLKNFFKIMHIQQTDEGSEVLIKLNPYHELYKGHFPGQAVVPGVCQTYILHHILERLTKRQLILKRAKNFKFLNIILPEKSDTLEVKIKFPTLAADIIKVTASVCAEGEVCFKFRGEFADL